MKTFTIIGADVADKTNTLHKPGIDLVIKGDEEMSASDGYHTFDELYEHRYALFVALCKSQEIAYGEGLGYRPWRSMNHSDGQPCFDGKWFILGLAKEKGNQITYHLPMSKWGETEFAETLDIAPEWDGHTSADVIERLKNL